MRRCIELAKLGAGSVSTNPMVGAVAVYNGKIIGEGFHKKFGEAHAEVNAINSVRNPELLPKSEIYVSLEPCAHFGKTPPCADLIIEKGIKKVYVGCLDPFLKVDGKGIQKLRNAGVEVITGILEKECQDLNRRFFTFVNLKRPYVILKWAQSLDGFLDKDFLPVKISSPLSNVLNHKWRSEEDAVLVGKTTAERDKPRLDNRLWSGKSPVRVILDKNGGDSTLASALTMKETVAAEILKTLYDNHIQSVIVEGGAKTHRLFLESGLWDEIRVFQSQKMLFNGTKAAQFQGELVENIKISDDRLLIFRKNQYLS